MKQAYFRSSSEKKKWSQTHHFKISPWEEANLRHRRIPNKLQRFFTLRRGSLTPHSVLLGTSFQRIQFGKQSGERNFTVEETDKLCCSQAAKVNTSRTGPVGRITRRALCLCGLHPKNPQPQSNHYLKKKNFRRIALKEHLRNTGPAFLRNSQGPPKQRLSEKLSQTRGTKETWKLTSCDVLDGLLEQ